MVGGQRRQPLPVAQQHALRRNAHQLLARPHPVQVLPSGHCHMAAVNSAVSAVVTATPRQFRRARTVFCGIWRSRRSVASRTAASGTAGFGAGGAAAGTAAGAGAADGAAAGAGDATGRAGAGWDGATGLTGCRAAIACATLSLYLSPGTVPKRARRPLASS